MLLVYVLLLSEIVLAQDAPVVNISPLLRKPHDKEAAERVLDELEQAFRTTGNVLLTGLGITATDREAYFSAAQGLLDLSLEEKLAVKVDPSKAIGRGYLPFGTESGLSEFLEPKEGFSYGHPHNEVAHNKMSSPNLWPAGLRPSAQDALSDLFLKLTDAATLLTDAIVQRRNAQAQQDASKRTHIEAEQGKYISLMRLFHYFSKSSPQFQAGGDRQRIGSSPHTDWGLLTLIVPNHVTGLQFVVNGTWVDVPYIPDAVVMNVGDFFSLATQGEYHSPVHRVLCPEHEDRLSFVLFFYPNYDSILQLPAREDSEAESVVSPQCREDEESRCLGEEAHAIAYNTLLAKHHLADSGRSSVRFGDYIVEKWEGVTRTTY